MTSIVNSNDSKNNNQTRNGMLLYFYLPHSTRSDNSTKIIIEKILKTHFQFQTVENIKDMNEDATILIWSSTFMSDKFFQSLPYKILLNHFPRSVEVGHKVNLYRNLNNVESDFLPLSFLSLYEWFQYIVEKHDKIDIPKYWVTKPIKGGGGRQIKVWSTEKLMLYCDNLKKKTFEGDTIINTKTKIVVQRYISNPLLHSESKTKFDIRAYVLVLSNGDIYLYTEGLLRMASKPYNLDENKLNDPYVHVTNNSVNKRNNIKHGACENLLWSEYFIRGEYEMEKNMMKNIMLQLKNITKTTFTDCFLENGKIKRECEKYKRKVKSFELFGIDCIIDNNYKVWLLEVNHMPEIETTNAARADKIMNDQLILDMFNLIFEKKKMLNTGDVEIVNKFCKII